MKNTLRATLSLLTLLAACSGGDSSGSGSVASITIGSVPATLGAGSTVQLTATLQDASGNTVTGQTVTWTADSTQYATINSTGLVTAVSPGTAHFTAIFGGAKATATIVIAPAAGSVANVVVAAPKTALQVGDAVQSTATTVDIFGATVTGHAVTWTSTAPNVATVSSTGLVTAVSTGTASIVASAAGKQGALAISVTSIPTILEQHLLAQQGLAIGLAMRTAQVESITLSYLLQGAGASTACTPLANGGSVREGGTPGHTPMLLVFYFDAACTRANLSESMNLPAVPGTTSMQTTVTTARFDPSGASLTPITFVDSSSALVFTNGVLTTGIFSGSAQVTDTNKGTVGQLAFSCTIGSGGHNIGTCRYGVLQDILNQTLASVVTIALDSSAAGAVTLSGTSTMTTGLPNLLFLNAPTQSSVVVQGGAPYGSATAVGTTAAFTVFPKATAGWTVTDAANDQTITINVVDNVTHNLTGTIKKISSGATLATLTLDQSGTGTITYSDQSAATISDWTISQ